MGDFTIAGGELKFSAVPDYQTPADTGTDNVYNVTVKVTDDEATPLSATKAVTVTVTNVNEAPTITTTTTTKTFAENQPVSTDVETFAASNVDASTTFAWSVESGDDGGKFDIDSSTGALTFKTSPNFEMLVQSGSTANEYKVTVKVTDNGAPEMSDTHVFNVNVTNVNEAPVFTAGDDTPTRSEVEYDASNPDYYVDTYTATDEDDGDTVSYTLDGTDSGDFEITSDGVLSFKQVTGSDHLPDYEDPKDDGLDNIYNIVVKAGDSVLTTDKTMIVTVTNVDETPEITSGSATPSFAEIEYDAGSADLEMETYTARDEEEETITWSLGGDDASDFTITKDTTTGVGVLTFNSRPDFETPAGTPAMVGDDPDNTYEIIVKATDGNVSPNTTENTREYPVTVTVDDVNERPDIDEDTVPDYMEVEYDFTGTLADVHTFAATDYDDMDTFEWSLLGEDAAHLDIGATSGVLTFSPPSAICLNDGPLPDYEEPCDGATGGTNTYNVTVRATDDDTSNQKYSDYAVTITVTDVNERPDIREDSVPDYVEVDFYFTGTPADVHTFTATDYDDGDTFEWSLLGDDAGDLEIDPSTGVLTFTRDSSLNVGPLPSFEDPQDQDEDNAYDITVVATDNPGKAVKYAVTITVSDAEEGGMVAAVLPNDPPHVDDELTFTLSDPDGGILLTSGNIDWTIEARVPADPPDDSVPWESIDDTDPLLLVKTYTVDEDHTGKEMRATVEYEDRRGSGKEATSGDTNAVNDERDAAPPRFRTGATQTIEEGEPGRDTEQEITATDRDGEALIFGIQPGPHSDLFELVPSAETTMMNYGGIDYPEYTARLRSIEALDYEALVDKTFDLTLTLSDGKGESNGRVIYDDTNDVDDFEVTITVTNVDEPGEITFSPEEVPQPEVAITATLTDGDGSIGGQMWQWQRSEEEEDEEAVWNDITGANSSSYTPDETADVISGGDNDGEGYYLRATVDYTDGEGGGKSAMAIAG